MSKQKELVAVPPEQVFSHFDADGVYRTIRTQLYEDPEYIEANTRLSDAVVKRDSYKAEIESIISERDTAVKALSGHVAEMVVAGASPEEIEVYRETERDRFAEYSVKQTNAEQSLEIYSQVVEKLTAVRLEVVGRVQRRLVSEIETAMIPVYNSFVESLRKAVNSLSEFISLVARLSDPSINFDSPDEPLSGEWLRNAYVISHSQFGLQAHVPEFVKEAKEVLSAMHSDVACPKAQWITEWLEQESRKDAERKAREADRKAEQLRLAAEAQPGDNEIVGTLKVVNGVQYRGETTRGELRRMRAAELTGAEVGEALRATVLDEDKANEQDPPGNEDREE